MSNSAQGVEISDAALTSLAAQIAAKLTTIEPLETMTFGELFELYYEKRVKQRLKNHKNAEYFFRVHGSRWRDVPVHQIKRKDLQDWVDAYGAKSQASATRALDMVQAIINWGIKHEHIPAITNPCKGVDRFHLPGRDRFLSLKELDLFGQSLQCESKLMHDFFWTCLLTGARKGNVLSMRWDEIDFDAATWTIPQAKFKNGSTHIIPLTNAALGLLLRRRESANMSPWVFPGRDATKHLAEVKRAWARVLSRTGLTGLTIHDLRRTKASYMAINGASPFVIAKMLGHKDLRSTAIYARLDLGAVRKEAEAVSEGWNKRLKELPAATSLVALDDRRSLVTRQPVPEPKNAGAIASPLDQIVIEGKIITALRAGGTTKASFYSKIGSQVRLNSVELARILGEMQMRGLISSYQDDKGQTKYALANSNAQAS